MAYFKHKTTTDQAPERRFIRPVTDDEFDDAGTPALADEDEEKARREDNLRMAMGLGDLLGVIAGVVLILLLLTVLISLVNWVHADVNTFFAIWTGRT